MQSLKWNIYECKYKLPMGCNESEIIIHQQYPTCNTITVPHFRFAGVLYRCDIIKNAKPLNTRVWPQQIDSSNAMLWKLSMGLWVYHSVMHGSGNKYRKRCRLRMSPTDSSNFKMILNSRNKLILCDKWAWVIYPGWLICHLFVTNM